MLTIDTNTMAISLTRGDSATIEFSAKDESGDTHLPVSGDSLSFAVAKKYGGDKLFSITNRFNDCFKAETVTSTEFNADKTSYFTKSGDTYNRCTSNDAWSSDTQYYINTMWNIEIEPDMTKGMKFGDYYWDLQLDTTSGNYTIIGKNDSIEPKFTVWGEVV